MGLPWWLSGKESACNAGASGDAGSVPGLGRSPGGGHGHPLQYSCLENPHGQRSLAGYSPRGRKESDTTEHIHTQKRERESGHVFRDYIRQGPCPQVARDVVMTFGYI